LDHRRRGIIRRTLHTHWFVAALLVWHFNLRGQLIIAGAILLLYWALLTLVSVDGYGGVLTLEGSINAWFDKNFLPSITYRNLSVDPEGLLSNLTSVVNAIAIYMASSLVNWTYSANSLFSGLILYNPDSWQPLLQVCALLVLQLGLLFWLFRKRIFIKI
jgi:predicted acyltransferase